MTLDHQVYALASARLIAGGWNHDGTIRELAERIQDVIEEFEADLANEMEAHHDRP